MVFPLERGISIHALVKRATIGNLNAPTDVTDFNPRPRKEGDIRFLLKTRQKLYFNPRPRKEGDLIIFHAVPAEAISIHALVKRATMTEY